MAKPNRLGKPYAFECQPSALTGNMTGASSGIFDPGKLALEEIGGVNWGELHAYMTRRFGPPNIGSDPYKEIARWVVTTPMDGLHLSITISPNSADLLFGYIMDRDIGKGFYAAKGAIDAARRERFEAWCQKTHGRRAPSWEMHDSGAQVTAEERRAAGVTTSEWYSAFEAQDVDPPHEANLHDKGTQALRRALRDLTRSVGVRDQDISALGIVDGDICSVETSPSAGSAPPTYVHGDAIRPLFGIIHRLGGGEVGLAKVLEIMGEHMTDMDAA